MTGTLSFLERFVCFLFYLMFPFIKYRYQCILNFVQFSVFKFSDSPFFLVVYDVYYPTIKILSFVDFYKINVKTNIVFLIIIQPTLISCMLTI